MKLIVKIILIISVATVVVLTSAFAILVKVEADNIKNQVTNDARTSSNIFKNEIEHNFKHIYDQLEYLQNSVKELSKIEGVVYIHITDMNGVHIAATQDELVGTEAETKELAIINEIKAGNIVSDVYNDKDSYYELERHIPIHLVRGDNSSKIVNVIEVEVLSRSKRTTDVLQAEKLLQVISLSIEQSGRVAIIERAKEINAIQNIADSVDELGKSNIDDKSGFFRRFIVSDDMLNTVASTDNEKFDFKLYLPEHEKYYYEILTGVIPEVSYMYPGNGERKDVLITIFPIKLVISGEEKIVGVLETQFLPSYYEERIASLKLRVFGVGVVVTILLAMLLVATINREVLAPILRYSVVAKKVAAGDYSQKIERTSNDEIGQFGKVFNLMVNNLLELDKTKSDFVSVAAHQLRTPLAGIKWVLKLFLDGDMGTMNEDQRGVLKRGYDTNEKMIQLVNDLLDVSRIENSKFGYHFKKDNFIKIISSAIENVELAAKERGVEVRFVNHAAEIPEFFFDSSKLTVAFQNILDNAIKYTFPGGKVDVSIEMVGDLANVKIADSGVGIPKNELTKLFSKFFRASNVIHLQTEGTGLGLFIVKNIIDKHGGHISVDSIEGKGTTFTVVLPTKSNTTQVV